LRKWVAKGCRCVRLPFVQPTQAKKALQRHFGKKPAPSAASSRHRTPHAQRAESSSLTAAMRIRFEEPIHSDPSRDLRNRCLLE
jgi:hypothetical protein